MEKESKISSAVGNKKQKHDDNSGGILEKDVFEVECWMDKRFLGGRTEYLVKWKGYADIDNTWEPERNLTNAQKILNDFKKKDSAVRSVMIPALSAGYWNSFIDKLRFIPGQETTSYPMRKLFDPATGTFMLLKNTLSSMRTLTLGGG